MYFIYEWVIEVVGRSSSGGLPLTDSRWVEVYKTTDKADAIETFSIYQVRGKTKLEYVT